MGWLGKYWGCDKIVGGRTLKAMKQSHAHILPRLFLSFIAWPNFCMKMGGGGLKPAASAKALAPPIFMQKFGHGMKT